MEIALWIATALLALSNLGAGTFKLVRPKDKLVEQQAWAADFSAGQVKAIGVAEVVGAVGLIVPRLTGILPVVTSVAAFAIVALQVGALVTHVRRKETVVPNVVIIALALFVGIGWLLV
jgi:hypothetical protein